MCRGSYPGREHVGSRAVGAGGAFAVLYGSAGPASSPVEKQEQREGLEQAAQGEEERPTPSPEPTTARAQVLADWMTDLFTRPDTSKLFEDSEHPTTGG